MTLNHFEIVEMTMDQTMIHRLKYLTENKIDFLTVGFIEGKEMTCLWGICD